MYVVSLRRKDGLFECLAWTKEKLSKKQLRKATKHLTKHDDVECTVQPEWSRFYDSIQEMKDDILEIDL